MKLLRLLRTLRHLKGRQLAGQAVIRLRARLEDPSRLRLSVPEDRARPRVRWAPRAEWLHPDGTPLPAADVLAGRFTFAGITREIGSPPPWADRAAPRLWRYNLHYHGFLFGLRFEEAHALVLDYIAEHPPAKDAEGWEPYPLSLRISSWIALFFGRWRAETLADADLAARLWLELRRMLRWLEGHLETHLMANHLLENAVTLSLAGACFEGAEAAGWRARGMRLLRAEMDEQILPDGGHFERSPMYQQRLLYALGLLINTGDDELWEACRHPAARMAGWLRAMTHPDGGIALFNDAGLGVYPDTGSLLAWLARMGVAPELACEHGEGWAALEPSGYFAARNDEGDVFFMDVGKIGPDYQPGHAHADFLAIELSLSGRRFVVDGGNKDYDRTPERAWARSVQAHSTVFVDGEEPLELWGAFRVGRRGRPVHVQHERGPGGAHVVRAGHTGNRHLRGRPTPCREATWTPAGILRLRDRVRGGGEFTFTTQLRIDGSWELDQIDADRVRFTKDGAEAWVLAGGPVRVSSCRCFPRLGTEAPAHLLRQSAAVASSATPLEWTLCRGAQLPRAESMATSGARPARAEGAR